MYKNVIRLMSCVFCILMIASGQGIAAEKIKLSAAVHEANVVKQEAESAVEAAPAEGEEINWEVISAGGGAGSSSNFILMGSVGQIAVGPGSSSNFGAQHGFWQNFDLGASYMCGDPNMDGIIDIGDPVNIINYLFKEGPPPVPLCIADVNGDVFVDIADAVDVINYIFKEGPAPVPDCCPWRSPQQQSSVSSSTVK